MCLKADFDAAIYNYKKTIDYDPYNAPAFYNLGNAYYMAARISYFDRKIPSKYFLFLAFKKRKAWVEEAKLHEIFYILFSPITRVFNPMINILFEKFGRSTNGA